MPSPYTDRTGVGNYLRPTATDLGKGKTTKEEEAEIKRLMGERARGADESLWEKGHPV